MLKLDLLYSLCKHARAQMAQFAALLGHLIVASKAGALNFIMSVCKNAPLQ